MLLWLWNSISSEDAEILWEVELQLGFFFLSHSKESKVKLHMYKKYIWKQHYGNIKVEILMVQRVKKLQVRFLIVSTMVSLITSEVHDSFHYL